MTVGKPGDQLGVCYIIEMRDPGDDRAYVDCSLETVCQGGGGVLWGNSSHILDILKLASNFDFE